MASVAALAPGPPGSSAVGAHGRRDLPPAIVRALSAGSQPIVGRAEAVVRTMLGERLDDASPDAWRGSRLTGDGFPFEIAFSTADDRLRFTLEPGPAGLAPRHRLDLAVAAMRRLSTVPVPDGVVRDLAAIQSGAPLRFGTWLGSRVGPTDAAFKLYVEVPPSRPTTAFVEPVALGDRTVERRMVAYVPKTRSFEWYSRVPSLEPRHMRTVLAPAQKEDEASRLLEVVEAAYGHRIRGRLPGPSVGVSYVDGGGAMTVTLHFYARALWGSDARIRQGFARIGREVGWDPEPYLEVSAPMATREDWRTYHAAMSISLDPANAMSYAIGLRPVA